MKHKLAAALFATSLLLASLLAGCTQAPTLTGVVLQGAGANSNSLFLYTTQGENFNGDVLYASLSEKVEITDAQGQTLALGDLQPGRLVQITYSGPVQESYPPTYTGVSEVQVLGPADAELYTLALQRQAEIQASLSP